MNYKLGKILSAIWNSSSLEWSRLGKQCITNLILHL